MDGGFIERRLLASFLMGEESTHKGVSDGELDGEFVKRRLLASFLMVKNQHTREFLMVS